MRDVSVRLRAQGAFRQAGLASAGAPLVVDAERRPGSCAQRLLADRVPAALAEAIGALVEARERPVDLRECLLSAFLESLVELTVERDRGHVAQMVVAP